MLGSKRNSSSHRKMEILIKFVLKQSLSSGTWLHSTTDPFKQDNNSPHLNLTNWCYLIRLQYFGQHA